MNKLLTGIMLHSRNETPPPLYTEPEPISSDGEKESPSSLPYFGRNSKVIISCNSLTSSSYMSASLTTMQILEEKTCLLIIQFQCHPSANRRFASLEIKWKLKQVDEACPTPRVIDVAPKHAIGARSEETHQQQHQVNHSAQYSFAGGGAGIEVNRKHSVERDISRAMIITGSIRGRQSNTAAWTVEENAGVKSGIPPHFCVALVATYEGSFMMDLDVVAKQHGAGGAFWRSVHHPKGQLQVDVDREHAEFKPFKPSETWGQWFPCITGEAAGSTIHRLEPLRR